MNKKKFTQELIKAIEKSFLFVVQSDNNNRSSKKVDIIHGTIANHLQSSLGDNFLIKAKNKNHQQEETIEGRYNDKKVDIVIKDKNNKTLGGISVKFILSSFQKNSNNYFENMLGETANIRANNIYYYQIIILLQITPNFFAQNKITFTDITIELLKKYETLSQDNPTSFYHSPSATLILILKDNFENECKELQSKQEYYQFYREKENNFNFTFSNEIKTDGFGEGVILNNYEKFFEKLLKQLN